MKKQHKRYSACTANYPRGTSWLFFYTFIRLPLGMLGGLFSFSIIIAEILLLRSLSVSLIIMILLTGAELAFNLILFLHLLWLTPLGYILNFISLGLEVIYAPFVECDQLDQALIYIFLSSLVWLLPNLIYFIKRKSLFYEDYSLLPENEAFIPDNNE